MRTNIIFTLIMVLLCHLFLGCKDDTYEVDKENNIPIGIVGEVSNKEIRIGVYHAGNLTIGGSYQFINDAILRIEKDNKMQTDLQQVDNRYYTSLKPLLLEQNAEYRLSCKIGNDLFVSSIQLPESFSLNYKYAFPVVSIDLSPLSKVSHNYVIELFKFKYPDQLIPIYFYSENVESDNFIYNEINQPYSKLFFYDQSGKKQIDMKISNEELGDQTYFLVVRSVPKLYYRFLYESEIQKGTKGMLIELPSNIKGGAIGFVGSAFYQKVELK